MLAGPQNMPKFSTVNSPRRRTSSPTSVVVADVTRATTALGGFGPVPEGAAIFVVGMAVAIAIAMWIGARA